ncbi:NAD(P)H-hydrate dehydratase [Pedobacter changchengzhani]|uniref:ADP-dependent (S)-NAD(P)H-hydrate dehydratase n=2 Tax=Pedobacter changchengzhani TaxID=2529274 RepID=A0A4R5MI12_9SPHI|nr:NAD(P)H-hydrate dehydratase [Pedobacter changchengzhani]
MRKADEFTIANTPITSIHLMENAAEAFVKSFSKDEGDENKNIAVFCGKGNNGGDGLAIARILSSSGYQNIKVYVVDFGKKQSDDFAINLQRLAGTKCKKYTINSLIDVKNITADIVIDAILGSGLNKPLTGDFAKLVQFINALKAKIYAVDVPTGFFADGILPKEYNGILAYKTICFQRPKINFFFPESITATENFEVVNIGLNENFIQQQHSDFYVIERSDAVKILQPRKRFSHKGSYGHALIIAGNTNTMGAALLCSMACLHAGAGLTTAYIPETGLVALNTLLPEVMFLPRDEYSRIENPSKYQAIAVGPGLGISEVNEKLLERLFDFEKPLVIDADAINILGENPDLCSRIPKNSILTPHIKEFDRLFGKHDNWWDRVQTARKQAEKLEVVILLKNQYSFVCAPNGKVYINETGNPAMAQGGMGDVLTGIIASFIAQSYSSVDASILACYIHGKAGDTLAKNNIVVTASNVANEISHELKNLICFKK